MGLFLEKLETFKTFWKVLFSGKVLKILDFFLESLDFFNCLEISRFVLDSLNFLEQPIISRKSLAQIWFLVILEGF